VVFLEWSIRRPLDIVISGLVVISIGDIWVGLDVLHSNGFKWIVIVEYDVICCNAFKHKNSWKFFKIDGQKVATFPSL
jgi:hypothetical protein